MGRWNIFCVVGLFFAVFLAAAATAGTAGRRMAGIATGQPESCPEYVEERLGDQHEAQTFPDEIFGTAQRAVESFREKVLVFCQKMLEANPYIVKVDEAVREVNKRVRQGSAGGEAGGALEAEEDGKEVKAAASIDRVRAAYEGGFWGELKPQSAMEAGRGMRWSTDWEFGDEEELEWTE